MQNRVQIIAPSSGCKDAEALLLQAVELLITNGFNVKPPQGLFAEGYAYCANSDNIRFEQLSSAIINPEVDIIWCFAGGYGAGKIASRCLNIKPSHPKILIGYSDITVLHGLFNWHYHMPSLHASGLKSVLVDRTQHYMQEITNVLHGSNISIELIPLTKTAAKAFVESVLTGGNLMVLTTMIGTKLHPRTKGKILVLEDIDEKGYRVDRCLNHLTQTGLIEQVEAIIFGDFTRSDEYLEYALQAFCATHQNIPIFRTNLIGHGNKNIPLVFNAKANIKNCTISVSNPWT